MTEAKVVQVNPFRRYFARQFDNVLAFVAVLLAAPLHFGAEQMSIVVRNLGLLMAPAIVLWLVIDSFLVFRQWNTPGKWLFRLRVKRLGGKPTLWESVDRAFTVLTFGQGGWIPMVGWYAEIQAYRDLTERGTTQWDRGKFVVEGMPFGMWRILLAAGALALVHIAAAALAVSFMLL